MQMKAKDLYFYLVQKQKFLQSVSASDKKNPKKLKLKVQTSTNQLKRAFKYYIHCILSSFTSCYKETSTLL